MRKRTFFFENLASDMDFDSIDKTYGMYHYKDKFSEIMYRTLKTYSDPTNNPTSDLKVPIIGIFTRRDESSNYYFVGVVLSRYKFIGNETLYSKVKNNILRSGTLIINEFPYMSYNYSKFRCDFILQSKGNKINRYDILPTITLLNGYDGKSIAAIKFGIGIVETEESYSRVNYFSSTFKMGSISQRHLTSSQTEFVSTINEYKTIFSENIGDIINESFNKRLSENEVMGVLDLIEELGKRRKDNISKILDEIQKENKEQLPSAWSMFLSITKYSSYETNLNMRRLLENIAERVLVVPEKMMNMINKLK